MCLCANTSTLFLFCATSPRTKSSRGSFQWWIYFKKLVGSWRDYSPLSHDRTPSRHCTTPSGCQVSLGHHAELRRKELSSSPRISLYHMRSAQPILLPTNTTFTLNSSVSKASTNIFVGFPHNKKRKASRRRIRQKLCNQILKAPCVKLHYHRKHQGGHRLSLAPSLLRLLWARSKDPLTPSLREYLSRGSISWCGPPSQWPPWMAELPPCCIDPVKNPKFCISMHDLTYVSSALNPQQKLEISRKKL